MWYYMYKERREMIEESQNALINSLKGRISKVLGLNNKSSLTLTEITELEEIYYDIDDLILSNKKVDDLNRFKKNLKFHSDSLKHSKNQYAKRHILPLINKIGTSSWENK